MNKKELWQIGGIFFATISTWIAAPIIIGLYTGSWLDNRYQTKPWLTLGLVLLAFIISNFGIYKESQKLFKRLDQVKIKPTVTKVDQNDRNQPQS